MKVVDVDLTVCVCSSEPFAILTGKQQVDWLSGAWISYKDKLYTKKKIIKKNNKNRQLRCGRLGGQQMYTKYASIWFHKVVFVFFVLYLASHKYLTHTLFGENVLDISAYKYTMLTKSSAYSLMAFKKHTDLGLTRSYQGLVAIDPQS